MSEAMMREHKFEREHVSGVAMYRISGVFDRSSAWALRDRIDHETAVEVLIDFSLVGEFSDLAIAVLAHGLTTTGRRVSFRGLRQHQLRIFRYCGVPLDDAGARTAMTPAGAVASGDWIPGPT